MAKGKAKTVQPELPSMPDKPEYTKLADRVIEIADEMSELRKEREQVATDLVEAMKKAKLRRVQYGERVFSVIDRRQLKVERRK